MKALTSGILEPCVVTINVSGHEHRVKACEPIIATVDGWYGAKLEVSGYAENESSFAIMIHKHKGVTYDTSGHLPVFQDRKTQVKAKFHMDAGDEIVCCVVNHENANDITLTHAKMTAVLIAKDEGEPEMNEDKKTIEQLRETIATLDKRLAEAQRLTVDAMTETHRWQNVANQWHIQHDKRSAEVVAAQAEAADLRAQVAALTPPEVAE